MDPDGKNQVNLTNNSDMDLVPSLSPDGKKILFVSDRKWEPDNKEDDNWNIFVMDVNGGNVKNLTGSPDSDMMPSWSSDGTMIVFAHAGAIWVMDAEGTKFLKITPVEEAYSWPDWSPDGKKILCNTLGDGGYSIWELGIDYDMVRQIVLNPTPDNYSGEVWSATGDRTIVKPVLTASAISQRNWNPLVKSFKTMTARYTGWDSGAQYSPDGSKISYQVSRKDGNIGIWDVYVMNADGSDPINLTQSISISGRGAFNDSISWSPDGKKMMFVSDRDGRPLDFGLPFKDAWQIYTMNPDGSNVTRIINNNYADGMPDWGRVPYDLAEKLKAPAMPELTIKPEATISALDLDQINKYYGKEMAIEGKVVEYGSSWDVENRPMLLYFNNPKQHCTGYDEWKQGQCGTDFRVIINIQDFKKFPDVFTYLNSKVRILGKIDRYKGAPCIIATDPQQITIIK
jgi:Tol biopolymer transport system component